MEYRDLSQRQRLSQNLGGKSRTEQHHKNEVNINAIIAKCRKTGYVPQAAGQAMYGDFTSAADYFTARNQLMESQKAFMSLPADIREKFKNDPGQLLAFLENEENRVEAQKLGLVIAPKEEPKAPETPVTPVG